MPLLYVNKTNDIDNIIEKCQYGTDNVLTILDHFMNKLSEEHIIKLLSKCHYYDEGKVLEKVMARFSLDNKPTEKFLQELVKHRISHIEHFAKYLIDIVGDDYVWPILKSADGADIKKIREQCPDLWTHISKDRYNWYEDREGEERCSVTNHFNDYIQSMWRDSKAVSYILHNYDVLTRWNIDKLVSSGCPENNVIEMANALKKVVPSENWNHNWTVRLFINAYDNQVIGLFEAIFDKVQDTDLYLIISKCRKWNLPLLLPVIRKHKGYNKELFKLILKENDEYHIPTLISHMEIGDFFDDEDIITKVVDTVSQCKDEVAKKKFYIKFSSILPNLIYI